MKKRLTKKFSKYRVELEVWTKDGNAPTDGTYINGDDTWSDCHIFHTTRAKNEYSASLAYAMDTGELSNSIMGNIKIEQAIVDDINEWAIENGY